MKGALASGGREAAVGIAENQQPVGPVLEEERLGFRQNLPHLIAECLTADAHVVVRVADPELAEEQAVQSIVVVLAGVNEDVVRVRVEHRDDQAEADHLGPRAEHRHHLHCRTSTG